MPEGKGKNQREALNMKQYLTYRNAVVGKRARSGNLDKPRNTQFSNTQQGKSRIKRHRNKNEDEGRPVVKCDCSRCEVLLSFMDIIEVFFS